LGIPAVEAEETVVAKNVWQKGYADIAYTWFSRARKQLSSLQPCVGSEGLTDVLLVVISKVVEIINVDSEDVAVDVVLGLYVAKKQGHADEIAEIMLVGPQLFK
jgi:hypothetical protein